MVISTEFPILCLLPHLLPYRLLCPRIALRGKAAVQTRRPVLCDQRGLNGNGAGAAEGIPEEFPAPIAGKLHHGGSQRLPQGRVVAHGTVAALMKARAGGIQIQRHLIVHD